MQNAEKVNSKRKWPQARTIQAVISDGDIDIIRKAAELTGSRSVSAFAKRAILAAADVAINGEPVEAENGEVENV